MASFYVVESLGSGGFGEVQKVCTEDENEEYACKILKSSDPSSLKRFKKEVKILERLDHPHIIKVVEAHLDEDSPFYVMPLYNCSLRSALPAIVGNEARILTIFGHILDACEYAHGHGVLHRDLKPENVLMNDDTDVVVTDFGLGRIVTAESTRVTKSGMWLGTPTYCAPEQISDFKHATDERSDVYSLGRMLYELFTGDDMVSQQDTGKVPTGFDFIVERCTQKDPAKRFQSVKELHAKMNEVVESRDLSARQADIDVLLKGASVTRLLGDEQYDKVTQLLAAIASNTDLARRLAMVMSQKLWAALWVQSRALTRKVIERFTTEVKERGWGFEYTDYIANACLRMWEAIPDDLAPKNWSI